MKTSMLFLPLLLILAIGCNQKDEKLITAYGAKADGTTNNAIAIQKAIDEISASGGGRLVVPPGNFMTGTIWLKSNVELHLELGATLLGPTNRNEYPAKGRPGIVMARNQKNISITGQGILDGQGQELMLDIFKKLRSGELKEDTIWLDLSDCKNVKVANCFINASDDAICLKSETPGSACENIFIDSCTVRSSANGLKFGTSGYGGFKNIKVRNLTVFDTYRSAIALESVDGGILENIDIQNVVAKNTGNAIFIRRGHRNVNGAVGTLKGVYIANVKAEIPLYKPDQGYPIEGPPDHLRPGEDKMPKRPSHFHIYGHPFLPYNLIPSSIVGLPGYPVQDVTLENIEITYGGMASKEIAWIPLKTIASVPENEAGYPEFSMFGELPAWGFYIRHAEGIKMKNVVVKYQKEDFRPAFVVDDVKGIQLTDLSVPTAKEMPVLYFNKSTDIVLNNLKLPVSEEKGVVKNP